MIAATQAFNSLVPYAIWASRPPLSTQKKAIDILKNSVSTMKEEAITAIYYAALLYESPSHGNDIFPLITKLLDEGLSFFYPFFVRSVRNMSKDDYDKNSKTIVNYLIPGKCHDPDNFYYWILLIAEQSIELRTSSIDFGEIIGQLICKDFSAKKFDSLDQLMNLIILFNHELETDLTPIGTSTIEYLFAYIKRKKEKGAEILTPIFCSCFTLFFFSPNPKSEPPEDNVFTQYSDHFCFFTKKLKFDCILNQQIPQSFISIARTFIKYQAKKPFNIQLAENAPLISYVELQAFTLLKLQNCGESLTDFNKKCISVLKKQSKTEVVLGLLKSINDSNASSIKCDNAEQILNTFESTLQNICTFSYTTQLQANCDNFIQQFMTKIVKSLDFTLTSLPAPESSSMEYFISAVNSSSLKKLLLMYKKYRQNITDKYNTTQAINEKILTVFNRELGTQCGPWYHSDSQNGKHFKSAKTFVSPYSLSNMKINPKFDIIKP
ncbi:hypothetical protein TRFO_37972 [Tritrichomonas foetus]|uniref:Uncharacterized protein n=1 Tax=Tritrichomonas foetus TaxID=1144522 RepID=A0A1J4JB70_9EUKA|nr:hypothetical protein TRFO_37972 [Tritrichomonas foetus]|eukprot:OHS95921.1 hypothetical protein TRFO_37972 [Tritrichomonas foetus]